MNVHIFYKDINDNIRMQDWQCETNAEALWLADDACRKGLLIAGEEMKVIPSHRVVMVTFAEAQGDVKQPKAVDEDGFSTLLMRWRAVAAEPCPAGMKCKLLLKLVEDLEKVIK